MSWFEYRPYVPVAQRRAEAAKEVAKHVKKGETVTPVKIDGRKTATKATVAKKPTKKVVSPPKAAKKKPIPKKG